MSAPKKFPPYKITEENGCQYIVDKNENDVVLSVSISNAYRDIYEETIMQLVCDKLNEIEK